MSTESVQFVELIRQSRRQPVTVLKWCPQCAAKTMHTVHDDDRDEIYTCEQCDNQQAYTVR
jgi:hypothetical protein